MITIDDVRIVLQEIIPEVEWDAADMSDLLQNPGRFNESKGWLKDDDGTRWVAYELWWNWYDDKEEELILIRVPYEGRMDCINDTITFAHNHIDNDIVFWTFQDRPDSWHGEERYNLHFWNIHGPINEKKTPEKMKIVMAGATNVKITQACSIDPEFANDPHSLIHTWKK